VIVFFFYHTENYNLLYDCIAFIQFTFQVLGSKFSMLN